MKKDLFLEQGRCAGHKEWPSRFQLHHLRASRHWPSLGKSEECHPEHHRKEGTIEDDNLQTYQPMDEHWNQESYNGKKERIGKQDKHMQRGVQTGTNVSREMPSTRSGEHIFQKWTQSQSQHFEWAVQVSVHEGKYFQHPWYRKIRHPHNAERQDRLERRP